MISFQTLLHSPAFKDGCELEAAGRRQLADFSTAFLYRDGAVYYVDEGILYLEPMNADSRDGFDVSPNEFYFDPHGAIPKDHIDAVQECLQGYSAGIALSPQAHEKISSLYGHYIVREGGVFLRVPEDDGLQRAEVDPATGELLALRFASAEERAAMNGPLFSEFPEA